MNPYIDIIIRTASVYLFMIIALRIFGKKELSQLNTADIILILLISNSVQNAMVGSNTSLNAGLIAALVLFIINFLYKKFISRFDIVRKFMQGKPEILVHNGIVEFKTLSRLGITDEEMKESMREHGVEHYRDIRLAMLEMDGNISIISGNDTLKHTHYKRKHNRKSLGGIN